MLKKAGLVTVGVTASLLAVAPIASAGEAESEHGSKSKDKESSHEGDHGKKDHGKKHHKSGQTCDFSGGDAAAGSKIGGDSGVGNIVAQAPIAGNNIANLANCSSFLNDNLSHNDLDVL